MAKNSSYGFLIIVAVVAFIGGMQLPKFMGKASSTEKACELKSAMRKLWEDHIAWTRNYIMSELANLDDLNDVTQRLLQNQVAIGNAIKPFYGNEAGDKLTTLLKEHIVLASKVVKAAKADNKNELDSANAQWHKNADEIASFLASANPNWPQETLKDMLYKHLEYTTGEAVSRLQHKWNEDIHFYDVNHDHMLMLSDALVDGIKKQFPNKA